MRTGYWTMAAALLLGANGAQAQQIKADQSAIVAELQARGYKAELITGKESDYVRTSDSGVPITIFFADCKAGKRGCTTVQFYTGFTDIDLTLEQVNGWSADSRWVRTYIDKDGDPVLEMDVDMDYGGLSRDLFWDNLSTFIGMIGAFRKQFG